MTSTEFLLQDITAMIDHHARWSWINWFVLQLLFWLSIGASVSAAYLASTESARRRLLALLALVPALSATAESSCNFTEQYRFHDEFLVELRSLHRRMVVDAPDPKVIAEALTELEKKMYPRYPATSLLGFNPKAK